MVETAAAASASDDGAAVQYYQDEAGRIFYYDLSGQPVYYDPQAQAAADDVDQLRERLSAYERYVSELQASLLSSSSSPLPALQTLAHELEQAQAENGRLQSLLGSLQSRLAAQAGQVTELMEDNCRIVQEYEEVCEQLSSQDDDRRRGREAERRDSSQLQLRRTQQGRGEEEGGDGGGDCRHDDTLQLLSGDAAQMEEQLQDGRQLTGALSRHWRLIVQQLRAVAAAAAPAAAPPRQSHLQLEGADADGLQQAAVDSGSAAVEAETAQHSVRALDWSLLLQETDIVSSLLARKDDSEHQLSMLLSHARRLLDPVALLLAPPASRQPLLLLPAAPSPSAATAAPPSSLSSSSLSPSPSRLAELQSERASLHEQLQAQQERAASLIRDKILLAKRIELAMEEKQLMEAMLREALQQAAAEKDEYRTRLELQLTAGQADTAEAGQQRRSTSSRRRTRAEEADDGSEERQEREQEGGDRRSNGLLPARQPPHSPALALPAASSSSSSSVAAAASVSADGSGLILSSTRRQQARRRRQTESGLLSSLRAFLFGSGQAALSEEDAALTAAGELEAGRVLSV